MLVTVEGGRVVRIEGDPENSATGGHVCLKGISYAWRADAPDRLLHPMRRTAAGGFERVSWEVALSDIAERLARVRAAHGPESVLYYEASGSHGALGRLAMAFWHQFGGCTLTYGDLCWPAGLEATRLTYGDNRHNHPRHTVDSRFILLWGHNPAETNVHQMRLILQAQERGAQVAVIDPRSTDTTDAADVHLQPRPGTDAALALGIAYLIVRAGLHDRAFLDAYGFGVDCYLSRLEDYPVGRVSEITGIPASRIEDLAFSFGRTKPALLIAGFGLQRNHHAGQTMRAVALLPALTGNVGVAGGGWQYANLASHAVVDPPLPREPAGVRRAIPVSRLGPGLIDLAGPPVRAAWVEKGNPASQNPRSTTVREALGRLDLLVVVDQFLTDTARLAHYVLPAKTLFEEEDVCTAYWHPYIQLRTKILEPPGEVKTETEIWRLLAARMGFDTRYFPATGADARELLAGMLGSNGRRLLEELRVRPVDPSGRGEIAFLDEGAPERGEDGEPAALRPLRFPTPSGRIEFASEDAAAAWGVGPVPAYQPLPEGHASPLSARYPLQLLSCKTRDRIHSQFGNLEAVREVERPHGLDMHPGDAAARGLCEGDTAVVWNDRGRIEVPVRLDSGLRPGIVHILEGRCHAGDPDVNVLTDAGVTDMNFGATFYECLVEVARGAGGAKCRVQSAECEVQKAEGGMRTAGRGSATGSTLGTPSTSSTGTSSTSTSSTIGTRTPGTGTSSTIGTSTFGTSTSSTSGTSSTASTSAFVIHLGRCVGCAACVLACRLENSWTSDTPWRRVLPLNLRRRPAGPTYFLSVACHHCERPACLAACPSGAYEKRADGVVVHRAERCIGCRYCEMACPFGAPRYDAARGLMTKCDLCHARLDRGEQPACVAACPTEALGFSGPGTARPDLGDVPGFADPAGCGPNVRFRLPRGSRRAAALRALADR
jgi:anaerobic selenocysteine-containing dehydrogenase/Fe-S-cluster-containing dehydrogenase component